MINCCEVIFIFYMKVSLEGSTNTMIELADMLKFSQDCARQCYSAKQFCDIKNEDSKPKMLEKDRKMTKPEWILLKHFNRGKQAREFIFEISEVLADASRYEDHWRPQLENLVGFIDGLIDFIKKDYNWEVK